MDSDPNGVSLYAATETKSAPKWHPGKDTTILPPPWDEFPGPHSWEQPLSLPLVERGL